MGVTQYIGARYIQLFADPAEWDSTRAYESLTVVLHNGNSYTSKQPVPIGIDIDNEKFWALSANYNAQVEVYRKETAKAVDTAEASLETAKEAVSKVEAETTRATDAEKVLTDNLAAEVTRATDADKVLTDNLAAETTRATDAEKVLTDNLAAEVSRATDAEKTNADAISAEASRATAAESAIKNQKYHMVVIGDSFTAADSTSSTGVWCTPIAKALGVTYHNFAIGGTGFLTGTDTTKYTGQINTAKQSTAFDNNLVTWVFICGCLNDMNKSANTFGAAIRETLSAAQSAFPNAKIVVVGPNTWNSFTLGNNDDTGMSTLYARYTLAVTCAYNGAMFVSTIYMGAGSDKYTNNSHPNSEIQNNIARCIFAQLFGSTEKTGISTFNVSDNNVTAKFYMYIEADGNMSLSGSFTTTSDFTGTAEIILPNNIQVYKRNVMILASDGKENISCGTPDFIDNTTKTGSKLSFYNCKASKTYYWSAIFPR